MVAAVCRYGSKSYKVHYACFECRKVFRRPSPWELLVQDGLEQTYRQLRAGGSEARNRRLAALEAKYFGRAQVCPDCRRPLANVGMDLRTPKRSDVRQWRIVADMFRLGHAFQTCGCNGPGFIPSNAADYRRYLVERRNAYQARLSDVRGAAALTPEERAQRSEYWAERLGAVEEAMRTEGECS